MCSSPTFVRALVSVLVLLPTIYGRFALILSGLPQLADEFTKCRCAACGNIIQAATGFVDTNERSGLPPVMAPILIADKVSGMALTQAVLRAFPP